MRGNRRDILCMSRDQLAVEYMRPAGPRFSASVPTVKILGIPVHNLTMEQTLNFIRDMAQSGEAHHVMTVNPEFIMIAQRNELFRRVLLHASLLLPDGFGILIGARILGQPLKERVTGVDTVRLLAGVAQHHGLSIFLLGGMPGVAERVAQILWTEHPGLRIAGTWAGSPHPSEEDDICSRIEAAKPHILLVAYGPPKQDLWIARTMPRLRIPVAMGVGGTFDFIAGIAKRAPSWMQKSGLEWLHRLAHEPYRWRRMMALPQFVVAVVRERLAVQYNAKG
jgi:N-acetylglucosaminyldiphosphoundecaprenol N-acetyl-beta-D-mannosaminyltransferase